MLRNAEYIYKNIIIADEENTTKNYCKKAQVGVDLSARNIYRLDTVGCVFKERSIASQLSEYELGEYSIASGDIRKGWMLQPGTYIIDLNEGCSFGTNDTGYIIMRSSLNRSGATIHSAVWDPGYTSRNNDKVLLMSVRITVENPLGIFIEKDARVAQLIVFKNEDTNLYDGQWQGGLKVSKK